MKTIEIFRKELYRNNNKYELIINEVWYSNKKRDRKKFYQININGKNRLYTSLHQTYYSYIRRIERGDM